MEVYSRLNKKNNTSSSQVREEFKTIAQALKRVVIIGLKRLDQFLLKLEKAFLKFLRKRKDEKMARLKNKLKRYEEEKARGK